MTCKKCPTSVGQRKHARMWGSGAEAGSGVGEAELGSNLAKKKYKVVIAP